MTDTQPASGAGPATEGCIVCGVVVPYGDLRCHDCIEAHYMEHTGTTAVLVRLTDDGPVREAEARAAAPQSDAVEGLPRNHVNWTGPDGEYEEHCEVVRLYEVTELRDRLADAEQRALPRQDERMDR